MPGVSQLASRGSTFKAKSSDPRVHVGSEHYVVILPINDSCNWLNLLQYSNIHRRASPSLVPIQVKHSGESLISRD